MSQECISLEVCPVASLFHASSLLLIIHVRILVILRSIVIVAIRCQVRFIIIGLWVSVLAIILSRLSQISHGAYPLLCWYYLRTYLIELRVDVLIDQVPHIMVIFFVVTAHAYISLILVLDAIFVCCTYHWIILFGLNSHERIEFAGVFEARVNGRKLMVGWTGIVVDIILDH